MYAASNRHDLTSGSIWKSLLRFALPLLAGSLVQQLYNTIDLIFVGNFIDKSASAAVGASSLLITCLVGVFGGIGVGSGIVIAQIFGSKDTTEHLSRAIHNTAAMSVVSGLLMLLLGYLLAPVYLMLVRTPTELLDSAAGYLRIYSLSFLSVIAYNFGSGILRALGDSKRPLYAQLLGGLLNVAMDYYPIFQVFGDSMRGVGKSKVPMLLVLLNICLIRTALLFAIVPQIPGVIGVAAVYPITWALTAIGMVGYYMHFHRRRDMAEKGHLRAGAADENI